MTKSINIGQKYGYWLVIGKAPGRGLWTCLCEGCNKTTRVIAGWRLHKSRSCGCMAKSHLKESILSKYGVANISQLESIKKKKVETLKQNFGEEGLRNTAI